ncbi:alpha/beta hydrolase [Fulvivirgaceae bacterium BMA10]|uniref:Alpha/beta hydrolase n=1 Tax=Splendidivirga corallicola TaxID=3051826 RepID=A0ABT8KMN6_9BACT|nr:alpha/beta hydrolase [Fulvivirgaceae bacterium BMA10]
MRTPEKQLNLRLRHPDYQKFLDINEHESERVKKHYRCYLDQKYGKAALQTLDIFPANIRGAPILVFIHGGYWRALDKKSYGFVAAPFVENDMTVCVVNYRLIPTVNMEMLLNDIKDVINWIQKEAFQYNGDPGAMILSGHSAGGHLALMSYLMNEGLRSSIQAICSLSGIFDLAPIKNSYLNEVLQLDENDVENFSVINQDLSAIKCPVLLSVGSDETDFFIGQSRNLYTENRSRAPIEYYEYKQLNHYQIVHKLGQEDSPLVNFILGKMNNKECNKK